MKPVILCVDDEKNILDVLSGQIDLEFGNSLNWEKADNGPDALELLTELMDDGLSVPLVICDCMMPYMRGDQFITEALSVCPDLKFIIITGQAPEDAHQFFVNHERVVAYMSKPWQREILCKAIRSSLGLLRHGTDTNRH